jgi:lactam utilization protein B
MQSATILAEEKAKLRAANHRQQRKRQQQRQYIARRGVIQAQEGRALAVEAQTGVQEGDQTQTPQAQTRAPPTCSKCHI